MPAMTNLKTNPYFSFFNQAFQHVTQVMTDTWSKVSTSVSHLSFSTSSNSFYQQAGTEPEFQHYQRWCSELKQLERDVLSTMDEKKLSPKVVRKGLLKFIHQLEKNIVSPIYFHYRLNHLKQKLAESHYPVIFQTIIEETQTRLKDKLQQQPKVAIKYFYEDVVNGVVELSGGKIVANALLTNLKYYQTLAPDLLYEAVVVEVQNFIQMHEKAFAVSAMQHDIYYENNIASSDYAALIKNVNACFEEAMVASATHEIDVASENSFTQKNHQPPSINWRFLSMAALAGTSAYLYRDELNQAFTTTNYHLNMIQQMPWHVAQQVDWSTNLFPTWSSLTHATLSYGLYQRLSLAENPIVWSAITILWTTLPQSMAQVIELSSLNGTSGLVMNGVNTGDYLGWAISSGDVNGDNIPDVLIGADEAGPGGSTQAGASYVVFGHGGPWPAALELSSLNGTNGFVINGVNATDYSGQAISSGDINGDNITDILIGAYLADPGGRSFAGASYVVFGSRGVWPASIELSSLNGTNGFVINGVNANDVSGRAISSGDINGDNITDILIGASSASPASGSYAGVSYVVFGSRGVWPASIELSSLNGTNGFVMNGVGGSDRSGYALSSGDVNGDTITDVLIGAYGAAPGGRGNAGASYVVFGHGGSWPASIELSSLNGTTGFVINGVNVGDKSGWALSSGDINGDNITDVLIGAPYARNETGASYVVFGHGGSWPASIELSSLNGTTGFVMNGVNVTDDSGYALSSGDVNGDNITDILIGAYLADPGGTGQAGASYVVFGSRGLWPASIELSSLTGTNGFVMNGVNVDDNSGFAISSGDINGDNITDILIGAYHAHPGGRGGAGASYVVFGSRNTSPVTTEQGTTASLTTIQTSSGYFSSSTTVEQASSSSTNSQSTGTLAAAVVVPTTIIICFGGVVGFVFYRKRQQSQPHASSLELQENQLQQQAQKFQHSLPPKKSDHKVVGEKYEILSRIYKDEAEALFTQEGLQISFQSGEKKKKFQLGEGQFGKIKLARHFQSKQFVGVKKIKGDTEIKASKDEAELQSKLKDCPNLMPLLDSVEIIDRDNQSILYQFMPLASFGNGKELQHLLTQVTEPALKNHLLVHVAKGLLTGLAAMHRLKVYHLDFKPSNFVIDKQGTPFIIDFGCAKQIESARLDYTNGDTWYFSPERFASARTFYLQHSSHPLALANERAKEFDAAKADAWALGLTLFELVTNRYLFDQHAKSADKLAQWDSRYFAQALATCEELQQPEKGSFFELIKGLLEPDPNNRWSIEQALASPVFKNSDKLWPSLEAQTQAFQQLKQANTKEPSLKKAEAAPINYIPKEQDEHYAEVYFHKTLGGNSSQSNQPIPKIYTTFQAQQTMFGARDNTQSQAYNLTLNPTEEATYALVAPKT